MSDDILSESVKDPQEKCVIRPNAFKLKLKKGMKLTVSFKRELKRVGCLYHPYLEGYVGPLEIKEDVRFILSEYKIKADLIEIFNPWEWRSTAINTLENQVEFLQKEIWDKDMQLIVEVERYDNTKSVWDFEDAPKEEGISDIRYAVELDFHKRYWEIKEGKERLEGLRESLEMHKQEEKNHETD